MEAPSQTGFPYLKIVNRTSYTDKIFWIATSKHKI